MSEEELKNFIKFVMKAASKSRPPSTESLMFHHGNRDNIGMFETEEGDLYWLKLEKI